jgi:hypothetical protein
MSKLFGIGLALMLGIAVAQPANAGHRYCRYYGGYYCPSYSYSYSNPSYGYGSNYATYYAPTAPVIATTPAPAAGQVAQSQNGVYRSFSDDPGQAAGAVTNQAAPVANFAPLAPEPASSYGTVENPYGGSSVTIRGTPSSGSNYGTAGNPYGGNGGVSYGGGSGSGSTGGTAGHPY